MFKTIIVFKSRREFLKLKELAVNIDPSFCFREVRRSTRKPHKEVFFLSRREPRGSPRRRRRGRLLDSEKNENLGPILCALIDYTFEIMLDLE